MSIYHLIMVCLVLPTLAAQGSSTACPVEDLTAQLRRIEGKTSQQEEACIEMVLTNVSSEPVVLAKTFSPSDRGFFPDTVVRFEVRDETGTMLQWKGQELENVISSQVTRVKPTRQDFLILRPGAEYSSKFCLDEGLFDYGLDLPGVYTIQATVTLHVCEWTLKSNSPTLLPGTRDWLDSLGCSLASGCLTTGSLTVELH